MSSSGEGNPASFPAPPTPQQREAIKGTAYSQDDWYETFDDALVDVAWAAAYAQGREDALRETRKRIAEMDTPGPWANGEPISDYDRGYNDALDAVLDELR